MIVDMPRTTTAAIAKRLVDLRDSGGAVALGRVLTLLVPTEDTRAEAAIEAANEASREHPCRIVVLASGDERGTSRLDGQVRVGGDAGASEVVVLRSYGPLTAHGAAMVIPLLLPDAPVVAWWPGEPPADPAADDIGAMAQRRITDSAAAGDPVRALERLSVAHVPGDTDFAWSRLTLWRGYLAAALDADPGQPVTAATVSGAVDSPSTELLAAWLALALDCPVTRVSAAPGSGIVGVRLARPGGDVELLRPGGRVATLSQPGQPERRLALARRSDTDCLAEELRRLDPDDVYGLVLTRGLAALAGGGRLGAAEAEARGVATSPAEAARRGAALDAAAEANAEQIAAADPAGVALAGEPSAAQVDAGEAQPRERARSGELGASAS